MQVFFSEEGLCLIVKITGEIDHHTSIEIREKIDRVFSKSKAKNIIFDFSSVVFMDSAGIGILIGRYKELAKQGGRVYAINLNHELVRLFSISGLGKIIPCLDSLEEALSYSGGK